MRREARESEARSKDERAGAEDPAALAASAPLLFLLSERSQRGNALGFVEAVAPTVAVGATPRATGFWVKETQRCDS
jgi:hypothetical protein